MGTTWPNTWILLDFNNANCTIRQSNMTRLEFPELNGHLNRNMIEHIRIIYIYKWGMFIKLYTAMFDYRMVGTIYLPVNKHVNGNSLICS